MQKIDVDNLIFEVTRKCNMKCEHCLRGNAQNKDITEEIINKVLDQVRYIGSITFTGGEPTLNVKSIKYIIDGIMKRNIGLDSFYIVLNGMIYSKELIDSLTDLHFYSESFMYGGEDMSALCLSLNDGYHDVHVPIENINMYKFYKLYREDKEGEITSIINEGNAYKNGIGTRSDVLNTMYYTIDDNDMRIEDILYINVDGDIIPSCDSSYNMQDYISLGNIFDNDISEIIIECGEEQ